MRLLMQKYGLPKPGYDENSLRDAINEIAGTDLTDFYNTLACAADEMPFAECPCLRRSGYEREPASRREQRTTCPAQSMGE